MSTHSPASELFSQQAFDNSPREDKAVYRALLEQYRMCGAPLWGCKGCPAHAIARQNIYEFVQL